MPILRFLLVASLALACGRDPDPPAADGLTRVQLALNWFPEAEHGGFYAALVHGYYRQRGLDAGLVVELKASAGGAETGAALAEYLLKHAEFWPCVKVVFSFNFPAVAAYSLRARPAATVATPVGWDELAGLDDPGGFTYASVPDRLAAGIDPWGELAEASAVLSVKARRAVGQTD